MAEVLVNLGNRSYRIFIGQGFLNKAGIFLDALNLTKKALIITDDNVKPLYGGILLDELKLAGYTADFFSVYPGEKSKNLKNLEQIYSKAIALKLDRKSAIIALGGGVVGDLAGFAAATYLRGAPFIQIPTTLLSQVDSSVGGKTAVNHELGKNLIGAFYQPSVVIIDPIVLNTLSKRDLRSGIAEIIKYGAFFDESFFNYLNDNAQAVLKKDAEVLTKIISRSCRIKADIVEKDEYESNLRMLLNFGHTIGHAIEAVAGYSLYTHGEGVAIGMRGAAIISGLLKLCGDSVLKRLEDILERFGLPLEAMGDFKTTEILNYLARDKKSIGGKINWVLLRNIGDAKITADVPDNVVKEAVLKLLRQ